MLLSIGFIKKIRPDPKSRAKRMGQLYTRLSYAIWQEVQKKLLITILTLHKHVCYTGNVIKSREVHYEQKTKVS